MSVVNVSSCVKCSGDINRKIYTDKKVLGFGSPTASIMIVGESPGQNDYLGGRPFLGREGQCLNKLLEISGIDTSAVYMSNLVKCRTVHKDSNNNRSPEPIEIKNCVDFLLQEIEIVKPRVIITLGSVPLQILTTNKTAKINKIKGVVSIHSNKESYILPTFDMGYILKNGGVLNNFTQKLSSVASEVVSHLNKAKELANNSKAFIDKKYVLVDCPEKLSEMQSEVYRSKKIAFDIESTGETEEGSGLDINCKILGIGFGVGEGHAYYVPLVVKEPVGFGLVDFWKGWEGGNGIPLKVIKTILEDKSIAKTAHNSKYDISRLKYTQGIKTSNLIWDTQCASYLKDENSSHRLKDLKNVYIDLISYEKKWNKITNKGKNTEKADINIIKDYCCGDVDATWRLTRDQIQEFKKLPHLMKFMKDYYVPLMEFVADFECTGVTYDIKTANKIKNKYKDKVVEIEKNIWINSGGIKFDISSPEQVGKVLYGKLKLPPGRKTKKGYATDKAELGRLSKLHIVPALIQEHRHAQKMASTYIDRPLKECDGNNRYHISLNPTGTVSGRFSSDLQNVPRIKDIKKLFIAPEGYKLVQADLSQAEVRCFAHYANEEVLQKAFDSESIDVHCLVASEIMGVLYEEFAHLYESKDPKYEEMRSSAKATTFGLLYGRGPASIAAEQGKSTAEAQDFIYRFFNRFKKCKEWIDNTHTKVMKTGQVNNIFGRIRRLPGVFSRDNELISRCKRQSVNSIIQSTAADITNLSLIRIHRELKRHELPAKIVMSVHDSIIPEVRNDYVENVSKLMVDIMESKPTPNFKVKMRADVDIYQKWGIAQ